MGVRLYSTTGIYPSLAKDATLYTFDPEPDTIRFNYRKTMDYDEIPVQFLPEGWDSYIQIRTITIGGSMTASGEDTLKTRMEKLDARSFYKSSFTAQPEFITSEEGVYGLGIDFPTTGSTEEKLAFVVFESQNYGFEVTHLTFTVVFKEISFIDVS